MSLRAFFAGAIGLGVLVPWAGAQEAALSFAATQPSKGRITWREQVRYERFDLDGEDIDQWTIDTMLAYGLSKDLSLNLTVPTVIHERSAPGEDDQAGLGDTTLSLKWRFWQHDPGPVDTNRLALLAGMRLPTGTDDLSTGGWDPRIGVIFTRVSGRHGLNATALYQFSTDGLSDPVRAGTGTADLATLETSYLFRISPSEYTAETDASLYFTVESFVDYETNGDFAWRIAPGLLYEARRFTLELSPIIPIVDDVEHRAEMEWGLAAGLRVLF